MRHVQLSPLLICAQKAEMSYSCVSIRCLVPVNISISHHPPFDFFFSHKCSPLYSCWQLQTDYVATRRLTSCCYVKRAIIQSTFLPLCRDQLLCTLTIRPPLLWTYLLLVPFKFLDITIFFKLSSCLTAIRCYPPRYLYNQDTSSTLQCDPIQSKAALLQRGREVFVGDPKSLCITNSVQ